MVDIVVYACECWEAQRIVDESSKIPAVRAFLYDYRHPNSSWITPQVGIFRSLSDFELHLNNLRHAQTLAQTIKEKGGYVFNSESLKHYIGDKWEQYAVLSRLGLPTIYTSLDAKDLTYPFIIKLRRGSHGRDVTLVHTEKEYLQWLHNRNTKDYLFQEPMEMGHDFRVIVLGGKIVGVMERTAAPGKIMANISQGGTGIGSTLPPAQLQDAIHAAAAFGLEYAGIDIISDCRGGYRILEVNRCAQFRGFENATGINLAKRIVEYCLANLGR
jgi:RimK family alpha-L-glutamate ligase